MAENLSADVPKVGHHVLDVLEEAALSRALVHQGRRDLAYELDAVHGMAALTPYEDLHVEVIQELLAAYVGLRAHPDNGAPVRENVEAHAVANDIPEAET